MNLFQEAKSVLDKDGKVNPLGPYGKQKLTGREISTYFRRNKITDPEIKKAVEVALDLGGAFDIAGKEIQKFYGRAVRNSKEVKDALVYANESVTVDGDSLEEEVLAEGMSKLLSPAQQKGVLKKWNEPEGSTFAKDVYSNAKIANKKDFIVTSHSVKDGDYYLSLLGNAPEGKEDKPLTAANTNMNADIRKICKKWSTAGKTSPNPAGMCFLEIERELCDKKYNKFAAADTMVREVVWGMVEDIMGIKIKTA